MNDAYHAKDKDVILIKCCDGLHNLQTITAKDPVKLEKKVDETLNCFIIAAIHLQHKSIEELIHQACCDILSIRDISHDLPQFTKQDSYLACLKNTDTHQLVSQVFQNATNQVRS